MTDYLEPVPVTFRMVGLESLREANKQMKMMSGNSGTVARATKSTRSFGFAAQNAGYQVQDFIVQVQGGQDPMRALGQQLPQLTVGMGAWGAAIGVVAAALPALITAMRDTNEEAETLDESLTAMDSAISGIGQTMGSLDLSSYAQQWHDVSEAQREALDATLQYQKFLAQISINEAAGGLGAVPGLPGPDADFQRAALSAAYDEFAESLGLTRQQMIALTEAYNDVRNAETRSVENIQQLRLSMQALYEAGGERNENLEETIQLLFKLENAQKQIETVDETRNNALVKEGTERWQERNDELARTYGLLEEIAVQGKFVTESILGLTQEQKDFIESVEDGQETLNDFSNNNLPEQFNLAAEAAQIFGDTFETALNGVAMGTQDLSDAVTNMVKVIIVELGKLAAYQGIAALFSGTSFGNAAASLLNNAKGNAFSGGDVVPFAKGGVVNRPTIFPMANGAGLMGEAGPEAILPLKRTSSGRLGVESTGMNVVVNNNAPGVAVNPRPSDDGLTIDIVMAQVSAAIDRGGNPISNSIERNYNVGRGRGVY